MLPLLKSGEATNVPPVATLVGDSPRQIQRWWQTDRTDGLVALVRVDHPAGKPAHLTEQAWVGVHVEWAAGRIGGQHEARRSLAQTWGVRYQSIHGISYQFKRRTVKGKTGRRRDDRYQWVGVSIAIAPKSGEGWCLLVPPGDTLCLNLFPATLREEWPDERIGVVRDGSGSDRGDTVIWPHGIIPLPLPPYSPELNAAEQVFRHVRTRLANDVFATIAERKDALTCAMEQVWDHPQGVTRMTQYPWWRDGVTAITTSLSSKSISSR